jgi:superfamily II DNA helicase RecQ
MGQECETVLKRKAETQSASHLSETSAKKLFYSQEPVVTALGCLNAAPAQFPLSQLQFHCIEFINESTVDSAVVIPTGSGKTRIIEMFGSRTGVSVAISPFSKLSTQLQTTLGEGVFRWPLSCSEEYCIQNAKKIVVAIEHCEYNSAFIYFLTRLNERRRITKFFVDEVHHLLQAGNPEFRRCLGNFWTFRSRLVELNIRAQVVGLTATLRNCDVEQLCKLMTGISRQMPIFRRSCYRSSITMELIWAHGDAEAQKKCVESSLMDAQIGKTIVFSTTLNIVNSVASELRCQAVTSGISLDAAAFEATNLISASSCAGHGLDLKDIMIVAILGVPFDVETLLQWAGRIRKTGKVKIFLNETTRVNRVIHNTYSQKTKK